MNKQKSLESDDEDEESDQEVIKTIEDIKPQVTNRKLNKEKTQITE